MAAEETEAVWRVRRTADGSFTLHHAGLGQACHSADGAWTEARERYVEACRIPALAREPGRSRLRVLDVATGLGTNLAALLEALAGSPVRLRVDTLERDPRVIREAARQLAAEEATGEARADLRWLAPVHAALALALERPRAIVPLAARHELRLWLGDGREEICNIDPEERYDAVFLDPFSPGVDPPLWQPAFLRELARRMAPHAILSTYSVSLPVRVALARAGLAVGGGARVGSKAAGTLASHAAELPPLDERSARKLARRLAGPRPSPS